MEYRAQVAPSGNAPDPAVVALVVAAQRGDRAAFTRLHALHVRAVHAVLLARVPAGEVDDLVQEVFMTVIARLDDVREPGRFPGWLMAIARNRATDWLRERATRPATTDLDDVHDGGAGAEPARAGATLEAAEALAAIRTLPEAYRETLLMRLCEGMSGPEIAERTGLDPGSVRVNLHRGMRLLRDKLEGITPRSEAGNE